MANIQDGILYWITGLSGAGKTTIGNRLYYEIKKQKKNVVLLDGDVLKKSVTDDDDPDPYSDSSRRRRAMKYSRICKMLTDQGLIVICCTIAMYDSVREWNRQNNKRYVEIFLDVPMDVLMERDQKGMYTKRANGTLNNLAGVDLDVEYPKNPDITIVNDGSHNVEECVDIILSHETDFESDFDRDTSYWNNFYLSTNKEIEKPSLFAEEVMKWIKPGKNLLELGCGNGRDSIYFAHNGINITAIDASHDAIKNLEQQKIKNSYFICDDFVRAPALFTGQYDYCYSRFSIHAITDAQEDDLLHNIFNVLKTGGYFFIEVRSIHDDLYGKGEKVAENAYFYNGHFRRFIKLDEFLDRITSAGFEIAYSAEEKGFAPFGDEDPYVIRVIAQKTA